MVGVNMVVVVCEQTLTHSCCECEMMLCDTYTKYPNLPASRSHLIINTGDPSTEKSFLSKQAV